MSNDPTYPTRTALDTARRHLEPVTSSLGDTLARGHDGYVKLTASEVANLEVALENVMRAQQEAGWLHDDLVDDAGSLTIELLTITALTIIPATLVLVWLAKMAGMVAGVSG